MVCLNCKEKESVIGFGKFCSSGCRTKYYRSQRINPRLVVCDYCKKEFTTTDSRIIYCSDCKKIRTKLSRLKKHGVCVICGGPTPDARRKTCSPEHMLELQRRQVYNFRKAYKYEITCKGCGKRVKRNYEKNNPYCWKCNTKNSDKIGRQGVKSERRLIEDIDKI